MYSKGAGKLPVYDGMGVKTVPRTASPTHVEFQFEECAVCMKEMCAVMQQPPQFVQYPNVVRGPRTKLIAFECIHGVCASCTHAILSGSGTCLIACPICRAPPSPEWKAFIRSDGHSMCNLHSRRRSWREAFIECVTLPLRATVPLGSRHRSRRGATQASTNL